MPLWVPRARCVNVSKLFHSSFVRYHRDCELNTKSFELFWIPSLLLAKWKIYAGVGLFVCLQATGHILQANAPFFFLQIHIDDELILKWAKWVEDPDHYKIWKIPISQYRWNFTNSYLRETLGFKWYLINGHGWVTCTGTPKSSRSITDLIWNLHLEVNMEKNTYNSKHEQIRFICCRKWSDQHAASTEQVSCRLGSGFSKWFCDFFFSSTFSTIHECKPYFHLMVAIFLVFDFHKCHLSECFHIVCLLPSPFDAAGFAAERTQL